jgi:hypothetical protein
MCKVEISKYEFALRNWNLFNLNVIIILCFPNKIVKLNVSKISVHEEAVLLYLDAYMCNGDHVYTNTKWNSAVSK